MARGQHVTVGKSTLVWIADYAVGDRTYIERVTRPEEGKGKYVRTSVATERLTVVGQHAQREHARVMPQNCEQCGCYREVTDLTPQQFRDARTADALDRSRQERARA